MIIESLYDITNLVCLIIQFLLCQLAITYFTP